MLVEGPAELFLIPPLVKSVLGIDLEEHGISVIPIFGVHFDVYAKLFGPSGITKRCAIVADGDLQPSDAIEIGDIDELPDLIRPNLKELENDFVKVFPCETTFERELTDAGSLPMLVEACKELSATTIAERLSDLLQGDFNQEAIIRAGDLVLATAKRFGKARFAQVASKHVQLASIIPGYINEAVGWLLENETE